MRKDPAQGPSTALINNQGPQAFSGPESPAERASFEARQILLRHPRIYRERPPLIDLHDRRAVHLPEGRLLRREMREITPAIRVQRACINEFPAA
jgi:hypothetical protein